MTDTKDLLTRYLILLSNTEIDLVHKGFPLDFPRYGYLENFWIKYTDPKAPNAEVWKEWLKDCLLSLK